MDAGLAGKVWGKLIPAAASFAANREARHPENHHHSASNVTVGPEPQTPLAADACGLAAGPRLAKDRPPSSPHWGLPPKYAAICRTAGAIRGSAMARAVCVQTAKPSLLSYSRCSRRAAIFICAAAAKRATAAGFHPIISCKVTPFEAWKAAQKHAAAAWLSTICGYAPASLSASASASSTGAVMAFSCFEVPNTVVSQRWILV